MNSQTLVHWVCSVVGWAAFTYKLRDLWRAPRNPIRWAVCTTLFLASAAVFLGAPAAIGFINRITGVANIAALLVYSLIVALSASAHVLLAYWRLPPERARLLSYRWAVTYAGIIAGMCLLFTVGETPVERVVDFDTYYATTPYIAEFILLYLLALAAAMVGLIAMCGRWARMVGRPWLRRGLCLITAGALCALGFSAAKLTAVAARWSGTDWDVLSSRLAPGLATVGLVISAVGYSLPSTGAKLSHMHGWALRCRAHRDLYPLWNALRQATPQIVPPVAVPWWEVELRLTRRLAEINDGRLALRSHCDPRVAETALQLGREAGLSDGDLRAVVEAARIKAAVAAKAAHLRFPHQAADTRTDAHGGAHGADELAWLVSVSRAFADSSVAAAAAAAAESVRDRRRDEDSDGGRGGTGDRDASAARPMDEN